MKTKQDNLKDLQYSENVQLAQSPSQTTDKKLNRLSAEIGVVAYVKKVCECAMRDINSDNSRFKYGLADDVILSSLKLLLLCNDINKSFCKKERQLLRMRLAYELKLLCILASLAFSPDALGFSIEQPKTNYKAMFIATMYNFIKIKTINLFKFIFYESLSIFKLRCSQKIS